MPELPEVETTRRSIEPALLHRTIADVTVGRDRLLRRQPIPADFRGRVKGTQVSEVGRLGKFLMISLNNDMTLVIHLGMSGKMQIRTADADSIDKHTQLILRTDDRQEIRLVDPRTFGFFVALDPDEMAEIVLPTLGRDALNDLPSSRQLLELFRSVTPIKAILLDQRKIAGIGNIYADEALFRAKIHPESPGDTLSLEQVKALRRAIRTTLQEALKWGGSSLDDLAYLLPDGRTGDFTKRLAAYGRSDEPCIRCRTPIRHIVLRQRSTHFCPTCQTF